MLNPGVDNSTNNQIYVHNTKLQLTAGLSIMDSNKLIFSCWFCDIKDDHQINIIFDMFT